MARDFGLTLISSSQPQELSTFALTLFKYRTEIDNQAVQVGS